MPLYEFYCDHCGEIREVLAVLGQESVICNKCKRLIKKKRYSPFAFKVVGGTPKNLTSQLHQDELDTTMDEYNRRKQNKTGKK